MTEFTLCMLAWLKCSTQVVTWIYTMHYMPAVGMWWWLIPVVHKFSKSWEPPQKPFHTEYLQILGATIQVSHCSNLVVESSTLALNSAMWSYCYASIVMPNSHFRDGHVPINSWSNIFHRISIGASTMVITVKAQYGYEQLHLNTVKGKGIFSLIIMSP
jgi:hypothetical protein